ncbi:MULTISPECIES: CbtA family protein [unclassified Chelatococcus]|uniref:CbtA family protein n=1 Tax=unclassified Chelatococcus TaxID=2638111 RepID=UPI001BCE8497|nr:MULTISPECIES: CbtA family protein [unclassified Chelatococcus]CAH1664576.1 Cobalt transporter subunit CbtA [Hyphomicrobiales bacterium]MBS7741721.1 CbtA family protein [Chelatococcus sp. HY11]MBX3544260.1 CbtA family protein [Chelatococcus sp.]MCO5079417.1 CbtA family protein [Chelatococcus sp.]CAH1681740.1 Cobalt transporter subunit CbtA [Hyphomicrobiales bacterium]
MFNRVLAVALVAGLVAGLAIAVLQHFTTTPLILAGEKFEKPEGTAALGGMSAGLFGAHMVQTSGVMLAHNVVKAHAPTGEGGDHAEGWSPADGLERSAFTGLTTIVTAIGFALILMAALLVAGETIDVRSALAFAAAAFVATGLAPALGLAPELPGSAAGPLVARQIWWVSTAVATAVALWLLIRTPAVWAKIIGILLLIAPHVVGAPHPEAYASGAPAELAGHFAAASLVVHAALWAAVAVAVGFFWPRLARRAA